MAPPKNIDRFEFFLEKATEIGIQEITPLICQRSERREVKTARLEKVLVAAMKQSLKTWLPKINDAIPFDKFISGCSSDGRLICSQQASGHLMDLARGKQDVLLLIGPEGDFTDQEMSLAEKSGFIKASLGRSRLRTETAGIVACSVVSLLHQE
jgi:16S rRNA (uracil1498-N3)-methyltransferase